MQLQEVTVTTGNGNSQNVTACLFVGRAHTETKKNAKETIPSAVFSSPNLGASNLL
jgi:hypothetical protein